MSLILGFLIGVAIGTILSIPITLGLCKFAFWCADKMGLL